MPMTVIHGHYQILHAAPDGDSVRFYPDQPDIWKRLHLRVRSNHAGGVQLRLDGIDALETHYRPQEGSLGLQHQPLQFAHEAAAKLLQFLGFKKVTRGANEVVTASEPSQTLGYILTRFADQYGRCVAFAFEGEPPAEDGHDIYLDATQLHRSANYQLLAAGLAYPTYYSKLYPDLRKSMTLAVKSAQKAHKGLWPLDKTTQGLTLDTLRSITDEGVILPKLFRRLLDYFAINDGSLSLAGFKSYLESREDRVIILPDGHVTGFDYVVTVNGQHVSLITPAENLIFIEK